jgi:hypothetical protein
MFIIKGDIWSIHETLAGKTSLGPGYLCVDETKIISFYIDYFNILVIVYRDNIRSCITYDIDDFKKLLEKQLSISNDVMDKINQLYYAPDGPGYLQAENQLNKKYLS